MFRDGLTQMELVPPEAQRLACDSAGLLSTTIIIVYNSIQYNE